jgi:PAS domain S-box-containing protein
MIKLFFSRFLLILFFCFFSANLVEAEDKTPVVTVGVFQLAPMVYIDDNGSPQGIFVEIIDAICDAEGWRVEYIKGTWNQGLEKVKTGKIDLMTAVMHLPRRESFLDFPKEATFNIWGQIYVHKDAGISGVFDMNGKTIGVLKGGANGENFIELLAKLGIQGRFVAFNSQEDVAQAIKEKRVDAGVFTNIHGYKYQQSHQLKQTQIVFDPSYLKYATAEGTNRQLLSTIDSYFSKWKSNQNSPYYKIIEKHFGISKNSKIPNWVWNIIIIGVSIIVGILIVVTFLMVFNKKLQNEVTVSTQKLVDELDMRKNTEKKLKKNEKRYRTIIQTAMNGFWLTDIKGNFLEVNDAYAQMSGYSTEELVSMQISDIEANENLEEMAEHIQKCVENGSGHFETVHRRKDFSTFDVEVNFRYLSIEEGRFVVFTRDITERKAAENEKNRQEILFKTMFNTIPDGVVITDTERVIQLANKGMNSIFGYKPEELLGKSTKILYADQKKYQKTGEIVFFGNAKKMENLYITRYKDMYGREFSGETFGAKLFDENNHWIGNLGIMRDITEREQAEMRIQQSQKMEAIGTLAGGIAHDFNNILFPIIGHSEMLLEDVPDDSPYRESINEIYTGSLRARDLVHQILAFSRQGSSELKLMKMQPIIKEALKLTRSTIPTTISINQNLQPNCGAVKADPTQIHQIVMNLTTNAYHAMEENGGELKITLKEIKLGDHELISPEMKPGSYACLTIADTGMGMSKDVIDKIYDPFFTTKENGKGTGMGLSVVHGIVKSMNGEIQVHSEPGKGTEFYIFLPIVKSYLKKQETQTNEPIFGGIERILLVDDEKSIIALERQALGRLGYQVTSCTSSIEALEAFRANPDKFNLVITDMAMPKMSGDKLATELIKIRPDIPILLCTGFSESMTEEKIKSIGIKGILLKPIIIRDLAKKMREVLDEIGAEEAS